MNLEELWGLLSGLCFPGMITTGPDSGKPGWPTEVVRLLAVPGGPVVVWTIDVAMAEVPDGMRKAELDQDTDQDGNCSL